MRFQGRAATLAAFAIAATVSLALLAAGAATASARTKPRLKATRPNGITITVLSGRADLIAGGQALVQIGLPHGVQPQRVRVTLGSRKVSGMFAVRSNGAFEGLVTGLKVGANTLAAQLPNGRGARITITDYPNGGPMFSGPQLEPWTCEAGAIDRYCDKAAQISYLYEPRGQDALQPYDPAHPPSNVASTTTDAGVTVPFIVREEIGYEDRDQYRIEELYHPGQPWQPWAPQTQWNHKVLVMHGFDCHATYGVTTAPFADGVTSTLHASIPGVPDSSVEGLGLGFAVMSTALDDSAADCNPALQAESILMAKEHLTDELGPIAYTIGTGASGGSLAQLWMANSYPGLYQGLIPQATFPDAGSSAQQIADYQALGTYFTAADKTNLLAWTPIQEAEVDGTAVENVPLLSFDADFSAKSFFPFIDPTNCTDYADGDTYISPQETYNASSNPGGVRCDIFDWVINLLGPQPKAQWDTEEQAIGHGFAGTPIDDVGIQYGLSALESHEITPAQFVDLNAKIGGFTGDFQPSPARLAATEPALANAYRSGYINEENNLNQVAIIDLTGSNDPGLAHDTYRALAVRARLQRDFGTSANMAVWEGAFPLLGDVNYTDQALKAMDRWLGAVQSDSSSRSLAAKVIADRPADITDQCSDGAGTVLSHTTCGQGVVPVYGTPRTVAGEPLTTDQNKCALVPLDRSSYDVTFTDAQWAQLQQTFSGGVCDYSKPGVSQQNTIPWLTYQTPQGKVIYGGKPMGAAPVSHAYRIVRRAVRHRH